MWPGSGSTSSNATTLAPTPGSPQTRWIRRLSGTGSCATSGSEGMAMARTPRRGTTVAVLTATFAGLAGLTSLPAAAHPGHEPDPVPTDQTAFQKVTLNDRPGEPMSLAVLPDLRVLHTARTGQVRINDPRTGLNPIAATVPVYQHDEEGLQGVAIDPDFRSEERRVG